MTSKETVLEYYQTHKRIVSPIFGIVKVTPQTLRHLENKSRNHVRSEKEKEIRFKCFVYIHEIIEKSHIYQEWKKEYRYEYIKVSGKKKYEKKLVECFGLVGIIDQKDGYKTRIKVVIKKVVGWKHAEMISVIPGRQIKGYNKLFFEETKKSNI